MRLEFQNLVIRSAELKDAAIITAWWNDGDIMEHAGFPLGLNTTIEKTEEQIKKNNEKDELLIIEINGKPVGEMNYREVYSNTMEIGIKICEPALRSKGYGTLIFSLFLSFLKRERECKLVILDTNLKNIRAQKFYERLGFIKERVDEDSWTNQMGEKQSSVHYSLSLE